jgi:t-SNARE complex subunit (syntaxin)
MEEKYINIHDLVKDYARLIDGQREEIKTLRKVIADVANNLGNGSAVSTEASIEFIQEVPKEVKLVCYYL